MRFKAGCRALVIASLGALAWTGAAPAVAQEQRGIDPNQGRSLVEVTLDSRAAAMRLQLQADRYGIEFNDHYLRRNGDGTVTATVFGYEDELDALANAGYDIGATIEGPATWREHAREYLQDRRQDAARRRGGAEEDRSGRVAPGRDRHPARRLLRELRRPLPVGRGQDPPRRRGADGLDLRRARSCRSPTTAAATRRSTPRRGS